MSVSLIETDDMIVFKGDYFSQFYKSPMIIDNLNFSCCEQWMMYNKALFFNDLETAKLIMNTDEPKEHKKLGRIVKNYDDAKWLKVCNDIVYKGNYYKFTQNLELKEKLLKTGNKLIAEGSSYDSRWGTGLNLEDTIKSPISMWGENRLGNIIMEVRNNIRYS